MELRAANQPLPMLRTRGPIEVDDRTQPARIRELMELSAILRWVHQRRADGNLPD